MEKLVYTRVGARMTNDPGLEGERNFCKVHNVQNTYILQHKE